MFSYILEVFNRTIKKHDERGESSIEAIDRFDFYDKSKDAYAIIATGESALYANIILKKGVATE